MKTKQFEFFTLVELKESEVAILCGKYAVTKERFKTFEEATKYLKRKPYEVIVNLINLCIDYEKEHTTNNNTNNTNSK